MNRGICPGTEVVPLPPSAKYTLPLMAFTDLRFKGQVHDPLPSSFFLSFPNLLLLVHFFSPFAVPLQLPHKTHILGSFLITGFSIQYVLAVPHTHACTTTQHTPGEEGRGSKCLMLWFQGDSVTAAKGRNRCASLRFN